jgi:uncharacterized protein YndB with AHSA1/START domain
MAETFQAEASVDIDAPPSRVWQVLVEPALISRYLHGTAVETEWAAGSPIYWRGEWQGKPYEDKGEVVAFDPPRRLAVTHWSPLTAEPDEPAYYHHVSYELEPLARERTRLTLTHANSPTQEAADTMIANGWRPMLEALKQVAEDGGAG